MRTMRSAEVCVCGAISDFAGTLKRMSTFGFDLPWRHDAEPSPTETETQGDTP